MARVGNIIKLAVAGSIGWIAGSAYERYNPLKIDAATTLPAQHVPPQPPANSTRAAQIMRFGFPSTDSIRMFDDFLLSYDRRTRNANWVFEHLTPEAVKPNDKIDRAKSEFTEDKNIHLYFRSQNTDFRRSGYDRGHLAAAANHRLHQDHLDQTFYLSNISPQVGRGFNRDKWNSLERYVRDMTRTNKNVYVCTGPLYIPRHEPDGKVYVKYEVIGTNNVAVPTHFFKVVVRETHNSEYHLESFILPNVVIDDSVPLESFHAPLNTIERTAGLIFFDRFPSQFFRSINRR